MKFSINNIVTDIGTYEVTDAIVSCCWCQAAIRIVCVRGIRILMSCNAIYSYLVVKILMGLILVIVIDIVL